MMVSKQDERGDSYFGPAQAVEEAAKTGPKAGPAKKERDLQGSLELYKKAQSLGNDKAQAKLTSSRRKRSNG